MGLLICYNRKCLVPLHTTFRIWILSHAAYSSYVFGCRKDPTVLLS